MPPIAAVRAVCDIFDYFVSRGHEVQLAGFSRGGFAVLNLMTLIGRYLPNRCNVLAAAAFFHTDHKQHLLDAPIVASAIKERRINFNFVFGEREDWIREVDEARVELLKYCAALEIPAGEFEFEPSELKWEERHGEWSVSMEGAFIPHRNVHYDPLPQFRVVKLTKGTGHDPTRAVIFEDAGLQDAILNSKIFHLNVNQ